MAGRSIVPRYVGFFATGTATGTATAAVVSATGPLFPAMEVEGFTRTIEAVESLVEDNQTSFDGMDVTVEGFVRGTGLLSATAVNLVSATGADVACRLYMIGAHGTLAFSVDNVKVQVMYDTAGQKERVYFKGTKRFVRDINSTGADVGFFTS